MKPKLISLLLVCVMLVFLAACAKDAPGTQPNETTKETDVQTTENVTTEDTTEENTTEPTAELAFNEDLLSDIGLTYSELVEKHGKKVDAIGFGGGIGYRFENGYGVYIWDYSDLDYGREILQGEGYPIPRDENHNIISESVQLPKSDKLCTDITLINAEDLLKNVAYPVNVSKIKNIGGIENFRTAKDGIATSFNYGTSFPYENFEIHIYHNDIETIEADSMVEVFMRTN